MVLKGHQQSKHKWTEKCESVIAAGYTGDTKRVTVTYEYDRSKLQISQQFQYRLEKGKKQRKKNPDDQTSKDKRSASNPGCCHTKLY